MAKTRAGSRTQWLAVGTIALGALFSFLFFSGGCKQETSNERAGREAREAFEKSKELLKDGLDKTRDLTKEGLEKSGEAAREGLDKTKEAAKEFQKGWQEGGK